MMMHSFPFRKNKRDFAVIKIPSKKSVLGYRKQDSAQEVHCYRKLFQLSSVCLLNQI